MSNDQQRGDQREDQREKASTRNVSSDDSNTTKQKFKNYTNPRS